MLWLADVTLPSGAQHFFAEDAVRFSGRDYLPYLRLLAGPRLTRSLAADAAELELANADLAVAALLDAEAFEGALCELCQLLVGLDEAVFVFHGRLTEQEQTDTGVRFRLVSELDPAQIELHPRLYAQLCTWRFAAKPCGYLAAEMSFTENLAERAADLFSATTIGDSTLALTPDVHRDRVVLLTDGTGRGQKRRIRSHTATTFTLYHPWTMTPDATTRFKVFAFAAGAPKLLFTAASAQLEATHDAGPQTNQVANSALAMTADEHKGDWLVIVGGLGTGAMRKIGGNTATTITIAAGETSLGVDDTSVFRVLFARCPKDFAPSCEDRARTEAFNGFPTLTPGVQQAVRGRQRSGDFGDFDRRDREWLP
jgi:hypothetical protein